MKHKTIRDGWIGYLERVIPSGASPVQVQETRRSFYAGAAHVMNLLAAVGDDPTITEDEGVKILDERAKEVENFASDIRNNRA
jgi:hypothetical protein